MGVGWTTLTLMDKFSTKAEVENASVCTHLQVSGAPRLSRGDLSPTTLLYSMATAVEHLLPLVSQKKLLSCLDVD